MSMQRRFSRTDIGLDELYDIIYPNNSEEYHTFLGTNKDIKAARESSHFANKIDEYYNDLLNNPAKIE